ncbi:MAG: hypothetical protein AAFY53_07680 [Pseudomonadota bacterium]
MRRVDRQCCNLIRFEPVCAQDWIARAKISGSKISGSKISGRMISGPKIFGPKIFGPMSVATHVRRHRCGSLVGGAQ